MLTINLKRVSSILLATATSLVLMFSLLLTPAFARGGSDDGMDDEIRGHDAEVAAGLEADDVSGMDDMDDMMDDGIRGHDAEVAAGLEVDEDENEVRGHDAEVAAGLEADDVSGMDDMDDGIRGHDAEVAAGLEDENDENGNRGQNRGPGNSAQLSNAEIQQMINALIERVLELEREILFLLGL